MPLWSRSVSGYSSSSKWTDDNTMGSPVEKVNCENANDTGFPPTTSAADGDILPPPIVQTSNRNEKKSVRMTGLTARWTNFIRRIGSVTAPSTSSLVGDTVDSNHTNRGDTRQENEPGQDVEGVVDEIVVDRGWSDEIRSSISHSEHGASPEKSGGSHPQAGSSEESLSVHDGFWSLWFPLVILRWRLWPKVEEFFSSRFSDEKAEQHYAEVGSTLTRVFRHTDSTINKEHWFLRKSLALWSSTWLIINWALGCGFVPQPFVVMDQIFYFGVRSLASITLNTSINTLDRTCDKSSCRVSLQKYPSSMTR
jgi:hypothetical protein